MTIELLEGVIRHYAWGSSTLLPDLLGRPRTGEPWAELWLGAHPGGPARVGAAGKRLDHCIAQDPTGTIGPEAAVSFGELPFMLKVLAAGQPLSLQAHPSTAQALAGYTREDELGIPVDSPERMFRDRSHKPELVCALEGGFDALCGLRALERTIALFDELSERDRELVEVRDRIAADPSPSGVRAVIGWMLHLEGEHVCALMDALRVAADGTSDAGFEREHEVARSLAQMWPTDPGVLLAMMLNVVRLEPGEALYLGAGTLHAYLGGLAIEVMANSDNVVRGGLTAKPVDADTLLEILDADSIEPEVQRPVVFEGRVDYRSGASEFSLSRFDVSDSVDLGAGPAIVLCTDGVVEIGSRVLGRGDAAWVPASSPPPRVEGTGTLFRAGLGRHP